MRKTRKAQVLTLLITAALLLSLLPAGIVQGAGRDITPMLSAVKVNLTVGGQPIIVDGAPVPGAVLQSYAVAELRVSWTLPEALFYGNAKAGDYFTISLPYNAMRFNVIDNEMPLAHNGEVLGHWTVQQSCPIVFTLTEAGARKLSLEGVFKFYGVTAIFETETTTGLAFNDLTVDVPTQPLEQYPVSDGFLADTYALYPLQETAITKYGMQYEPGKKEIYWQINLNEENMVSAMKKEPFKVLQNAYFEDTLTGGQRVSDLWITASVNYPFSTGAPSEWSAFTIDLSDYFPKIENTQGVSDEVFLQSIRTAGTPCYGFSADKSRVVVSFGSIPGNGVRYAENDAAFRAEMPENMSEAEKDMIIERLGDGGLAGGAVLSYIVQITAAAEGAQNVYTNTAKFAHSKGAEQSTAEDVIMTEIAGSITGVTANTAMLEKVDAESGAAIEGATFKLQVKDGNGDFADYTPVAGAAVRVTNSEGQIEYSDLPAGVYRFAEVAAAAGYDADSVQYSMEQFAIIEGESGVKVTASNEKLPEEPPVVTPGISVYPLGWMRSTEVKKDSYLFGIGSGEWQYADALANTPLKYFEDNNVRSKANEKADEGTEFTRPVDEQYVGIEHIWDRGNYFSKYKKENGASLYDWASWTHWGMLGLVDGELGEYSIRRFSAYFEMDEQTLDTISNAFIAPEDELGNMSYLFPVNDTVFVFVNGQLAYWGGTDIVEGENQYGALNRTTFMGMPGIKVRNGVNGLFKDIFPHTDGWCIDLSANSDLVNIKSLLKPGFNRVDVFADEFWEGGGMNRIDLFVER